MVNRVFVIIVLFTISSSLLSKKIHYTGQETVILISTFETTNCFASYVTINGRKYFVKQKKDEKKQLAVVRDALAAYIARDLKIAHTVDIIASKKKIPGKINPQWPATIHTIAHGETVRKQRNCKYSALRLKQHWSFPDPNNEIGLTKSIINHMSWHKQLAIIVALDLMIGNSDRHCGNLFYDATTDSFCAIDMDDTFNKDLCFLACEKLQSMITRGQAVFTQEEISALTRMKNTLKFLVRKHKPQDSIEKLYSFAKKAGFVKGSEIYTDSIGRKLLYYQEMIIQTHASACRLIILLDKIISLGNSRRVN